jgi:hypothetical protein
MPVGLVVKKASKIWSAFVASIPAPESSTVIVTSLVSSLDPTARARRFSAVVLIASAPFMIRLSSTSRNWTGSAEIRGKSAARFVLRAIFPRPQFSTRQIENVAHESIDRNPLVCVLLEHRAYA